MFKASINSKLASGIINNTKVYKHKTFEEVFENQKPDIIDFLKKILVINPKKRMNMEEALEHEYLSEFKKELELIETAQKISFDYTHEFQLEVALFKEKIMTDMLENN
jgi:serine/threonine protein kinase